MAFSKQITLPNGIPGNYHKILSINSTADLKELEVKVGSWISRDSYLQNNPAAWNHYHKIPIGATVDVANNYIKIQEPFVGATEIEELDNTTLEGSKLSKWTTIKNHRDWLEYAGFTWDNSTFDSDPQSQSRIQGGVQLALMAQQSNQPFSINWTLKDNTVRTLNIQDMLAVGQALASHIQTLHQTSRTLREQLNAATTVEQVQAIGWPV